MKILLINTFLYRRGGDCTYMFSLGELLKSKGHEVYYWGMKHPLNIIHDNEDCFPEYIDYVEMNANKNPINALKVLTRSIYSFEAKKKLEAFLCIVKPDIIHLNNIHAHLTPSIIDVIHKRNIPIFWTLHDYKFLCPNTHFLNHGVICEKCKGGRYFHCVFQKCKKDSYAASFVATLEAYIHAILGVKDNICHYISPSNFLKNKFIEFGWNQETISVVNNFLPTSSFQNHSENIGNYLLYFGQLELWKGIKTLLEVASLMPQVKFKIAGDGTLKEYVQQFIERNPAKNIEYSGYQQGKSLQSLIQNSRAVIVPSEWYENFPYSVLESLAMGKPVIGARIGGIPELVKDGETGFTFEYGNSEDLRKRIVYLLDNPNLVVEMGKKAREFVEENFNSEKYYQGLIKIYQKAIGKHR